MSNSDKPKPGEYYAHTPSKQNPHWNPLAKHILEVAERAREYAEPLGFGADTIANYLGLLHDLGKFTPKFQDYLRECYLAEIHKTPAPAKGSAPHKQHGAFAATILDKPTGKLWGLPLHGHHGGMKSPDNTGSDVMGTFESHGVEDSVSYVNELLILAERTDTQLAVSKPDMTECMKSPLVQDAEALEMFVRLVFSCLVDADAWDTERHKNPSQSERREVDSPTVAELRDALAKRQKGFESAEDNEVNRVRREVYIACVEAGRNHAPGFFNLTVPTGGGKTLSSLAFALEHALHHPAKNGAKRRIIFGIPYTTIIDQTADVFRNIFGDTKGVLLEHHSAIEPRTSVADAKRRKDFGDAKDEEQDRADETEAWRLLAAETWESPLIVTTTVQLFESLFSRKPGACRKLHRLANSIIILDEAQCLPANLLAPIRSALKTLVEHFGVTVVFCTATQPAHEVGSKWLAEIKPLPIVPTDRTAVHFNALKRVRWHLKPEPWDWPRVAQEMAAKAEIPTLCVVNTRKQAQYLIAALDARGVSKDDVLHLSTLLCPAHRREVIAEVKKRLEPRRRETDPKPLFLISTTVIEAGVDLSFPRLFRALGPLERMIQAAGRCNRNGELGREGGEVIVFYPQDAKMPRGWYERCLLATQSLINRGLVEFDDPSAVTEYFADLFRHLDKDAGSEINDLRRKLDYEDVAHLFRMIQQDTVDVFVPQFQPKTDPEAPKHVLAKIERIGTMTRALWREASPYMVSVFAHMAQGRTREIVPGFLVWEGQYDNRLGIPQDSEPADSGPAPGDLIL